MEPNFDTHKTEYQRLAATSRRREHRNPDPDADSTRSRNSRAGSDRAGSTRAGSTRAGSTRAGFARAGVETIRTPRGRPNTGGSEVSWKFTGKAFTEGVSNREQELKTGCGIHPRVWPDDDPRISEVPIKSRHEITFASTALAAHGGIVPRKHKVEEAIDRSKHQLTTWHEHCHNNSCAARKTVRPMRVAGLLSARYGYLNTAPGCRVGTEDRPEWMREDEDLPGGYNYCPSDALNQLPEGTRGKGDPSRFGIDAHFTATFV